MWMHYTIIETTKEKKQHISVCIWTAVSERKKNGYVAFWCWRLEANECENYPLFYQHRKKGNGTQ